MSVNTGKQLHWTQRIALVRHNLHAASRSGDFGFFKALQAAGMLEGTNHFASLAATLGDEADTVMAAMDNLNGGMAFIHQDAFRNVYNNIKDSMRDESTKAADKSKLYVDITMQKNMAAMAIEKLCNSAIALINQQPAAQAQDQAANVFVTGATLIADCIEVVIKQLDTIDQKMDDFIRLEESWNIVKASVVSANAGLKGVYYMLDAPEPQETTRSPSIASAGSSVFRRLSTAFQGSHSPAPGTRASSIASAGAAPSSTYRTPAYVRNSISAGCPTSMPSNTNSAAFNLNSFNSNGSSFNSNAFDRNIFKAHKLSTIPPTPHSEELDPFDTDDMEDVPPMPEIPVALQPNSGSVAVS
ncbi:hypothetical protein CB0940_06439 [Cercospora beticola]|uniref:Uncharacterized protein n=1 Tax=Cercospora beticola TaxID=122368 RepID=A0A2G5HZT3_CERBT|nr:hypothetical protein CB0940_06439 [Cercospora beticola]PIA98030.1 hypothetical protein CB0940_06439 [Cercospora beticola]WPA99075.1 hypothetical protein RHO25_003690 [Cercospora beticola]CAK1360382.1 unnamed protein product [Cercospora beticola]